MKKPNPLKDNKPTRNRRLYGYVKWEKEQKRKWGTTSVKDALGSLYGRLGIENRIREQEAVFTWPEVVGDQIASVTTAQSIKNGVLTVKVADAVWKTELSYRKEDLKKLLNEALGRNVVLNIRFS